MSDTPRTDQICPALYLGSPGLVTADFCRQLERELAAKDRAISELRGDKDRLDWLSSNMSYGPPGPTQMDVRLEVSLSGGGMTRQISLRGYVDAAMEALAPDATGDRREG